MSKTSGIEWTDATWNPVTGCTEVSPGCAHCYAKTFAERWRGTPGHAYELGFDLTLRPERLDQPSRWRKPRMIFVNSMSDLFHEDIPASYIAAVYHVMKETPRHIYQVLTKRSHRMRDLMIWDLSMNGGTLEPEDGMDHIWHGVSVENQRFAVERIPDLLAIPSAVKFLSCEPLLGAVDLSPWIDQLQWVIVGGESGPGARPMGTRSP